MNVVLNDITEPQKQKPQRERRGFSVSDGGPERNRPEPEDVWAYFQPAREACESV